MRQLMEERRNLLRELGDLGAKRGHAEGELAILLEKAQTLADAHEEALADINEAERISKDLPKSHLLKHCWMMLQHSKDLPRA